MTNLSLVEDKVTLLAASDEVLDKIFNETLGDKDKYSPKSYEYVKASVKSHWVSRARTCRWHILNIKRDIEYLKKNNPEMDDYDINSILNLILEDNLTSFHSIDFLMNDLFPDDEDVLMLASLSPSDPNLFVIEPY